MIFNFDTNKLVDEEELKGILEKIKVEQAKLSQEINKYPPGHMIKNVTTPWVTTNNHVVDSHVSETIIKLNPITQWAKIIELMRELNITVDDLECILEDIKEEQHGKNSN